MGYKIIHEGSVKDFYSKSDPTESNFGYGFLSFKQRPDGTGPVSIFDLKEKFPFGIKGKDHFMYRESVNFFELMKKNSIRTHYVKDLGNREIAVYVAHIPPKKGWEEWVKTRGEKPFLVPMEVIISNTITPVASLHKRLRTGKKKPEDYGLERPPERYESVTPPEPVITTSTKLGDTDVYRDDLFEVLGLNEEKKAELVELAKRANGVSRDHASGAGLDLADGKFEFIMDAYGRLYICDTFLTSDENRILTENEYGKLVDLSKQFLRNLYTINGYRQIIEAEQEEGLPYFEDWTVPEILDEKTMKVVEKSYAVVYQQLCGEPMGLDLKKVATEVQDTLDKFREKYKRDETGAEI